MRPAVMHVLQHMSTTATGQLPYQVAAAGPLTKIALTAITALFGSRAGLR